MSLVYLCRLLRISAKPHRTTKSYYGLITYFYILIGIACVVSFPNGAAFILSGTGNLKNNPNCFVFN